MILTRHGKQDMGHFDGCMAQGSQLFASTSSFIFTVFMLALLPAKSKTFFLCFSSIISLQLSRLLPSTQYSFIQSLILGLAEDLLRTLHLKDLLSWCFTPVNIEILGQQMTTCLRYPSKERGIETWPRCSELGSKQLMGTKATTKQNALKAIRR